MKKTSPRQKSMDKVLRTIQRWPTVHPSIANLAAATKLSGRFVQKLLREAEEAGLVRISYSVGRGLANTYEVLVEAPEKVNRKGELVHPLRTSTSYSSSVRTSSRSADEGMSTATPAVVGQTSLEEPPWWMREVRLPKKGEEWPRDAEGRRLALLDGTTEGTKCRACCQVIRRREPGTNRVLPPSGVLMDWSGSGKEVPVHMAGGCAGSRPGQGFTTAGDIGQDMARRRHLRVV